MTQAGAVAAGEALSLGVIDFSQAVDKVVDMSATAVDRSGESVTDRWTTSDGPRHPLRAPTASVDNGNAAHLRGSWFSTLSTNAMNMTDLSMDQWAAHKSGGAVPVDRVIHGGRLPPLDSAVSGAWKDDVEPQRPGLAPEGRTDR